MNVDIAGELQRFFASSQWLVMGLVFLCILSPILSSVVRVTAKLLVFRPKLTMWITAVLVLLLVKWRPLA